MCNNGSARALDGAGQMATGLRMNGLLHSPERARLHYAVQAAPEIIITLELILENTALSGRLTRVRRISWAMRGGSRLFHHISQGWNMPH